MVRLGDTFIFRLSDDHLWVVVTTPRGVHGEFLAVNLTSVKGAKPRDDSCILSPGDHPFVRWETEINYARARVWQETGFDSLSGYGDAVEKRQSMSKSVLRRIQEGALGSDLMAIELQQLVKKELGR